MEKREVVQLLRGCIKTVSAGGGEVTGSCSLFNQAMVAMQAGKVTHFKISRKFFKEDKTIVWTKWIDLILACNNIQVIQSKEQVAGLKCVCEYTKQIFGQSEVRKLVVERHQQSLNYNTTVNVWQKMFAGESVQECLTEMKWKLQQQKFIFITIPPRKPWWFEPVLRWMRWTHDDHILSGSNHSLCQSVSIGNKRKTFLILSMKICLSEKKQLQGFFCFF